MTATPPDDFKVEGYDRVFSREQIVTLLAESIGIVEELEPPLELVHDVFSVAHQMLSTVTPKEPAVVTAPAMAIPRGRG
jgi:hypothetical protein